MCKRSNALSRPVLMVRGLDGFFDLSLLVEGLRPVGGRPCNAVFKLRRGRGRAFGSPRFRRVSVVIARGLHLFPFRTEQLSPSAPMVLGPRGPGRVGRRRSSLGPPLGAALLFTAAGPPGRPTRECSRAAVVASRSVDSAAACPL